MLFRRTAQLLASRSKPSFSGSCCSSTPRPESRKPQALRSHHASLERRSALGNPALARAVLAGAVGEVVDEQTTCGKHHAMPGRLLCESLKPSLQCTRPWDPHLCSAALETRPRDAQKSGEGTKASHVQQHLGRPKVPEAQDRMLDSSRAHRQPSNHLREAKRSAKSRGHHCDQKLGLT